MSALVALAFDFGLKRIGVATGTALTGLASPLTTVACRAGTPDWQAISRCVRDWDPAVFIVGLPYNMDGSPSTLAAAAEAFGAELTRRYQRPVTLVDERLSSREAEDRLRQRRASGAMVRRVDKADIDATAAAVLLEQWLHQRGHQTGPSL